MEKIISETFKAYNSEEFELLKMFIKDKEVISVQVPPTTPCLEVSWVCSGYTSDVSLLSHEIDEENLTITIKAEKENFRDNKVIRNFALAISDLLYDNGIKDISHIVEKNDDWIGGLGVLCT